jgi:hypothetical protein
MVKYPDVSLLIQGPMNSRFPFMHSDVQQFGEVIVSTWSEDAHRFREFFNDMTKIYGSDKYKVVHQPFEIDPCLDVQYNMGRQALTILKGLRACTKPYVLKHRTDEYYSNLDVLVDKFYEGGCKKWVCAPVCFLPATQYKFHVADHLYIAPRERLINTFKLVMASLWGGAYERNRNGEPAAEITFTTRFLHAGGYNIHPDVMKENFDIVPLESLEPFSIKIGTKGFEFNTAEQVYQDMPFLRGATIEELTRI